MRRALLFIIALAAVAAGAMHVLDVGPRLPFASESRPSPSTPSPSTPSASAPQARTKYDEAKDHIRRAKSLLGDVARESAGTANAHYAGLQAAALENIFANDVPVAPVMLTDPVYWRVLRVETTEAYTKVGVEIENTSPTRVSCFHVFDQSPVVLVADRKVYAMKKNAAIARPANVEECYGDDRWALQPTQAITLDLYFDTLDRGTIDGMLKYASEHFREEPARFSLVNTNQSAVR